MSVNLHQWLIFPACDRWRLFIHGLAFHFRHIMLLIKVVNGNWHPPPPQSVPQFQDIGDVSGWKYSADVVEVSNIEASVRSTGQGDRGQKFVPISEAIATWARNASPPPVPHYAPYDRGLLRDELVFPVAFVQNTWWATKENERGGAPKGTVLACFRDIITNNYKSSAG